MERINKEMLTRVASSTPLKKTTHDYWQSTETLPHIVSGQSIQLSIPEWINTKFMEAFNHKWSHKELPSTWIQGISVMTVKEIRISVSKAILDGNGWPPSLPEFIGLSRDEINFDMAYSRMLAKKPEGRVEQWVYERAAFNIRRESDDKARRSHKRFMEEAIELERLGKLELNEDMLKALPPNSVINTNDLARQNYEERNGKKLHPRIQAILNSKKEGDQE